MDGNPIRDSGSLGGNRDSDIVEIQEFSVARIDSLEHRFFDGEQRLVAVGDISEICPFFWLPDKSADIRSKGYRGLDINANASELSRGRDDRSRKLRIVSD